MGGAVRTAVACWRQSSGAPIAEWWPDKPLAHAPVVSACLRQRRLGASGPRTKGNPASVRGVSLRWI